MIKLMGALIVVIGCGGFGFMMAAAHRNRERALRQLIRGLDFMECELEYRLTPLPELCRQTGRELGGDMGKVFAQLADELDGQIAPDVGTCMAAAVCRVGPWEDVIEKELKRLGSSLGLFDLAGQLKGLEGIRRDCRVQLEELGRNREARLRGYQTLSLCAGAALAILFL